MTAPLRDGLMGGWVLASFTSRNVDTGAVSEPLGAEPQGLILYTADGSMSAQLARGDGTDYIAYGGRFTIDEDAATVRHHVTMSTIPELMATPQLRRAALAGDRLTLSARSTDAGVTTENTLVWRRMPAGSETAATS